MFWSWDEKKTPRVLGFVLYFALILDESWLGAFNDTLFSQFMTTSDMYALNLYQRESKITD